MSLTSMLAKARLNYLLVLEGRGRGLRFFVFLKCLVNLVIMAFVFIRRSWARRFAFIAYLSFPAVRKQELMMMSSTPSSCLEQLMTHWTAQDEPSWMRLYLFA